MRRTIRWTPEALIKNLGIILSTDVRFMGWLTGPGKRGALKAVRAAVAKCTLTHLELRTAGFILLKLGDPRGTECLLRALECPDYQLWVGLLVSLKGGWGELCLDRAAFEPILLGCLKEPDNHLGVIAIQVAAHYPTAAISSRLPELLAYPEPTVRAGTATTLLWNDPSVEALTVAAEYFLRNEEQRFGSGVLLRNGISRLATQGSGELRERASDVLHQFVTLHHGTDERRIVNSVLNAMSAMVESGHAGTESLLLSVHSAAKASVLRGHALLLLARHFGSKHARRVLRDLKDGAVWQYAARAIGALKPQSLPRWAMEKVARAAMEELLYSDRDAMVEALIRIGGPAVTKMLSSLDAGPSKSLRMKLHWELQGWTPAKASRRLAEMGLISKASKAQLAKIAAGWRKSRSPLSVICELFAADSKCIAFDHEAPVVPVRYENLLEALSGASAGRFLPRAIVQRSPSPRSVGPEAAYHVQFRCGRKLHRFKALDRGDWYDVSAVLGAANAALEASGAAERFRLLDAGGGQVAMCLFGDAAALEQAKRELALPLEDP